MCNEACNSAAYSAMLPDPFLMDAGTTHSPDGELTDATGHPVQQPGDLPALLAVSQCAALCNDSSLYYDPDR